MTEDRNLVGMVGMEEQFHPTWEKCQTAKGIPTCLHACADTFVGGGETAPPSPPSPPVRPYTPILVLHGRLPADPNHPDPDVEDPGRNARLAFKAGLLIHREIMAARRDRAISSREKAAKAIVGTPGGMAASRDITFVPADDAGEFRGEVQDPTPLDDYRRRGRVDARQFEAGDKLRKAWHRSRINIDPPAGAGAADYAPRSSRGEPSHSQDELDAAAGAWEVYRRAMDRLPVRYRKTVFNVVIDEEHLFHGVAAMERLQDGLDVLADHFGLPHMDFSSAISCTQS